MVLAIAYRVCSTRGTQFRQWATQHLAEFMLKGFVMDDERLKDPAWDYFDELLSRIRASERRFYQKITDIYATATDYSARTETRQSFFASVQNKLHWATAAELIKERADSTKPNMGLTSWSGSQSVSKTDSLVAKNYLNQDEMDALNRIVTMYLDYAEDQAHKQQPMTMQQWADKLDAFLQFNDRAVLTHAGKMKNSLSTELVPLFITV